MKKQKTREIDTTTTTKKKPEPVEINVTNGW